MQCLPQNEQQNYLSTLFPSLSPLLNDWEENMRKNRENAKDGCHWHQDWHQTLFVQLRMPVICQLASALQCRVMLQYIDNFQIWKCQQSSWLFIQDRSGHHSISGHTCFVLSFNSVWQQHWQVCWKPWCLCTNHTSQLSTCCHCE